MRLLTLLVCLSLLTAAAGHAQAAQRLTYEVKAFQDALDTGKPVLVHVTAPWCGECKAQKPIVAALALTPDFKDLIIIDVDFDTQKDALRQLKVQKQSTLVM